MPKDQVYALKLKGISICFSMLKAALSGSYVNFGVFRLYGDDALDNALQTFIKLLLSIPHSDLLVRDQGLGCQKDWGVPGIGRVPGVPGIWSIPRKGSIPIPRFWFGMGLKSHPVWNSWDRGRTLNPFG